SGWEQHRLGRFDRLGRHRRQRAYLRRRRRKLEMTTAPASAKLYIALVIVSGLGVIGFAIVNANPIHLARLAAFLLVACVAARLKVRLPGITGTMSVNLPFILVAVAEMSLAEALLVGCISNLVQCLPRGEQKFNWIRMAFNFCVMALAVEVTRW